MPILFYLYPTQFPFSLHCFESDKGGFYLLAIFFKYECQTLTPLQAGAQKKCILAKLLPGRHRRAASGEGLEPADLWSCFQEGLGDTARPQSGGTWGVSPTTLT